MAYPRIVAAESREISARNQVRSGLDTLDALLGGGVEEGSSTLVSGPPGAGIGLDLRQPLAAGLLTVVQIDPAELSPGQFAHAVCKAADEGAKVIVIDSLNGYMNAMPEARFLTTHLREVLTYLGQRGVATFLIGVQQGIIGLMGNSVDVSYLADNVLLLRYYEANGAVHKALSVFKKRGSEHETTLRSFDITRQGIKVGPVLNDFRGILTGVPVQVDSQKDRPEHA